jgi:hypothetical protein
LIETTRAVLNSRMRAKFALKDVRFMILNLRVGGTGAPDDSGYTKIYSTRYAFTAVKADGSVTAWGGSDANDTVRL